MIKSRLTTLSLPAVAVFVLFLSSVEASTVLCTRGNITVSSAVYHQILVSPDKCYPIPVIHRNQLHSKPGIQMLIEIPKKNINYTVVMVEVNKPTDQYVLYWLEPNLILDINHQLVQNISRFRDVRQMVEYRPPKVSPYNLTYHIYVYRQPSTPVWLPQPGPFNPRVWASNSRLQLIGSAEFIVRGNVSSPPLSPAHHQPIPSPGVFLPHPSGRPQYPQQQPPPPGFNTATYNISYPRNNTNSSHWRPSAPVYPHPQPAYPPPPAYHPSGGHRHKGAAVDLQAKSYLIILLSVLAFALHQ